MTTGESDNGRWVGLSHDDGRYFDQVSDISSAQDDTKQTRQLRYRTAVFPSLVTALRYQPKQLDDGRNLQSERCFVFSPTPSLMRTPS